MRMTGWHVACKQRRVPLSTHSLHYRVHTRVLLTLVIAIAAVWCLWTVAWSDPAKSAARPPEAAIGHSTGRLQPARLLAEHKVLRTPAAADQHFFLQ